jgi:CheY-like chemotaxis protein
VAPGTTPAKSLLIIEDNALAREGLGLVLQQRGYQVTLTADGRQALAYFEGGARPDLILLDMLMPDVDGWQFLEKLGRLVPFPSIPLIIMTSTIITRDWALDHGAAGFLKKPFSTEELLAEIERCT